MKKIAISVLMACALAFAQAQGSNTSLTGTWKIHSSIAGNDGDSSCTFTQTNNDLSGTCTAPDGTVKLTGKVDGQKVTWSYDIQYNGNPLTMKYEGTLDSGKITGTVTVEQYGVSGDFAASQSTAAETAMSAPATAAAAAPAAAAPPPSNLSVGGKWKVKGSIAGNEVNSECTFVQTSNDLTGTCIKADGPSNITGKVDGQKVTWSYDIDYNGSPLTMKYEGTFDSGKIAGSVTVVQFGAGGDFTATAEN
jgi:hypothetical protein